MFNLLKLCLNREVTVYYVEKGIDKDVKGILTKVEDYKAITIKINDGANMRIGFISNFSAIRCIRFKGIPIYNNSHIPPKYGYNPLGIPNNLKEKNKQKIKKFGDNTDI